jgi:hypothetical protein
VKFSCGFPAEMTHKERGFVFLSGLGAAQAAQKNKTSLQRSLLPPILSPEGREGGRKTSRTIALKNFCKKYCLSTQDDLFDTFFLV